MSYDEKVVLKLKENGEFKRQLDVLSSEERIDELKELLQNFITENGTCSDLERLKKNLRTLREDLNERAERRLFGLREFDEHADKETRERVLARNAFEKRALDDVVDAMLVDSKLQAFDEATHQIRKSLNISYKTASIPKAIYDATIVATMVFVVQFVIFSLIFWFADNSSYFSAVKKCIDILLIGNPIVLFFVFGLPVSIWLETYSKARRSRKG